MTTPNPNQLLPCPLDDALYRVQMRIEAMSDYRLIPLFKADLELIFNAAKQSRTPPQQQIPDEVVEKMGVVLDELSTHMNSLQNALCECIQHEKDSDDLAYWKHEHKAHVYNWSLLREALSLYNQHKAKQGSTNKRT